MTKSIISPKIITKEGYVAKIILYKSRMTYIDKIIETEREKFERQRISQRRITRILAASFLPIFLGIGLISFITLFGSLTRQTFMSISATILGYSLLSGFIEYIKFKRIGQQKSLLFIIIQLLLFAFVTFFVNYILRY